MLEIRFVLRTDPVQGFPGIKLKNPPGEPGGIKQLKTHYLEWKSHREKASVRSFTIQEGIDRTDLRIVILIRLHFIIAVEILHIGDGVVQL